MDNFWIFFFVSFLLFSGKAFFVDQNAFDEISFRFNLEIHASIVLSKNIHSSYWQWLRSESELNYQRRNQNRFLIFFSPPQKILQKYKREKKVDKRWSHIKKCINNCESVTIPEHVIRFSANDIIRILFCIAYNRPSYI